MKILDFEKSCRINGPFLFKKFKIRKIHQYSWRESSKITEIGKFGSKILMLTLIYTKFADFVAPMNFQNFKSKGEMVDNIPLFSGAASEISELF